MTTAPRLLHPLSLRARLVLVLLVAGAIERAGWNMAHEVSSAGGEAFLVAFAFGQGHGIADAYGRGFGPTAHLLPISPAIAGTVYALLGYTRGAEVVLAAWSIGLALGSYLLLDRGFALLGVSSRVRLAALAFLCLVPTYVAQEAVDFRVWEGGLASLLSALLLCVLLGPDSRLHRRAAIVIAPLLFFVQPMLGVAGFCGLALRWFRSVSWRSFVGRMASALVLLALIVTPWAIRNRMVLGEPVLLRSNAGLELSLVYYPGADAAGNRGEAFWNRLHTVHPLQSRDAQLALLADGGEVRYSRNLGAEAGSWMRAHPAQSAHIMLTHLGDMIAPPVWIFRLWGDARIAWIQAGIASAAGVLGLLGLCCALLSRDRRWWFVALNIVVPMVLFVPFQPVMRYIYLLYAPLVFCAAAGPQMLLRKFDAEVTAVQQLPVIN